MALLLGGRANLLHPTPTRIAVLGAWLLYVRIATNASASSSCYASKVVGGK